MYIRTSVCCFDCVLMRNLWEELIQLSLPIGKDEMGTLLARFPTMDNVMVYKF
jgi:hypothetical protein